jgi:hypothetical protein
MVMSLLLVAGCGDESSDDDANSTAGGGSGGGTTQPQAGVPSDGCAEGFVHDGDAGCRAVLPDAPCAPGLMAVPGDSACRAIADCGSDTWGNIPIEPNSQHVDGGYTGGNSDGTSTRPWTTITDGILAADNGAIVAVAAGSYAEDIDVVARSMRLWGRCPELVEIVGSSGATGTLFLSYVGPFEVRGLAIVANGTRGIIGSDIESLLVDSVWIHDTGQRGINVEETFGPTVLTVSNTLIENVREYGVYVAGSTATIERTHIRDMGVQLSDNSGGEALHVRADPDQTGRANVTLRSSFIERAQRSGVAASGSEITIEATAIRDTLPGSTGELGTGVQLLSDPDFGPINGNILGCTFERNHTGSIAVEASTVHISNTTVRATLAQVSDNSFGRGVQVQNDDANAPGQVSLVNSLVEDSLDIGILAFDSSLTVDGVLLRRTSSRPDGSFGDDISLVSVYGAASANVTRTQVADSARAGLANFGGDVAISESTFLCNPVQLNGEAYGRDFSFDDGGGNACSCGSEQSDCTVLSTDLEPPAAP